MTDSELAWAAGLFEGEGCISSSAAHAMAPRLQLSMTDLDVVGRFHAIVGYGAIIQLRPQVEGYKTQWRWGLANPPQIVEVLAWFTPWLGERRLAKAKQVLDTYAELYAAKYAPRECRFCKHIFVPQFRGCNAVFCSDGCKTIFHNRKLGRRAA